MEYEIIYSKRKTLSLQVKADLTVIVKAPRGLSRNYIENFVNQKADWINERLEKYKNLPFNPYTFTKQEIGELKRKTLEIVEPRVAHFAAIMELTPNKVSVSSARSRFASCNSRGNLNFSFRLCLYPQEAIDYVVVHELAHMVEMNHSKRFWAIVEKYMPDYKDRKKLLSI